MAVTVILPNGNRRSVNGRVGQIIEWLAERHEEMAKHDRVEIEIHMAGERVTIAPKPIENLPPAKD